MSWSRTGWARALEPVAGQVAQMGEFLRAEIAAGQPTCPQGRMCCAPSRFRSIRCGCSSSDRIPYPTPGHAVGLSFSVAADVRPLPRSLENIYKEYGTDLGYPAPANGDLTPWAAARRDAAQQGADRAAGHPASHRGKGWEAVTECAIRALVARSQPMVAVLWGRDASTLKPMLDGSDCVAIESAHPSPLSASRGFFGSRPFSRANELLAADGCRPDRLAAALIADLAADPHRACGEIVISRENAICPQTRGR